MLILFMLILVNIPKLCYTPFKEVVLGCTPRRSYIIIKITVTWLGARLFFSSIIIDESYDST